MTTSPESAPAIVLDTNVVLDWLVFANPACRPLAGAISARQVRWVATAPMQDELDHVVGSDRLVRWRPDARAVHTVWALHCELVPAPAPTAPAGRLRCSDVDDQMFIDLAVARAARWLVTRDRAVLKLARRLREVGVLATTPERWALPPGTAPH